MKYNVKYSSIEQEGGIMNYYFRNCMDELMEYFNIYNYNFYMSELEPKFNYWLFKNYEKIGEPKSSHDELLEDKINKKINCALSQIKNDNIAKGILLNSIDSNISKISSYKNTIKESLGSANVIGLKPKETLLKIMNKLRIRLISELPTPIQEY